jgi:hypothetical protein
MVEIIEPGASGSKLKHRCILIASKDMGNRTWAHGAIASEDNHIKWDASSSMIT